MISGLPPGINNLPPMARKSLLFASTSLETMCQCPIVTPISLNGAGCARAVPAVSVKANNKATHTIVFMDASLLRRCAASRFSARRGAGLWVRRLARARKQPLPRAHQYHRPGVAQQAAVLRAGSLD